MSVVEMRRAESEADRLAVLAVDHAARGRGGSALHFAALRLETVKRQDADWWLLLEDGVPVSSLICYPLVFREGERQRSGYGLGAVATTPGARRRGHARQLCEAAIEAAEAEGRDLGLLFSAIAPAYYEKSGFVVAPAVAHASDQLDEIARSGERAELVPIDPRRDVEHLCALYTQAHPGLHLHRDPQAWLHSLACSPGDTFYVLGSPARGYVRLYVDEPDEVDFVEPIVPADECAAVFRAVAALARDMGRTRLSGWFDVPPDLAPFFEPGSRERTWPMLRGAEDPAAARFWGTDHF